MQRQQNLICFALLFTCGLALSACKHGRLNDEKASYLFVQTAKSGKLLATNASKGEYRLVLEEISPITVYFSDRPKRDAGHESTPWFVSSWGKGRRSFKATPPNAALDVIREGDRSDVYVLTLSAPRLDVQSRTLSYDVTLIESPGDNLAFTSPRLATGTPDSQSYETRFGLAALYIDNQSQGACDESDVRAALYKSNHELWNKLDVCATKSWGNADQTSTCLNSDYPALSSKCASCFGQMAHCTAQHCALECAFNHKSKGCQTCAYTSCQDPSTAKGFTLSACSGLASEDLPTPNAS